jgi:hypothetical protein
MAPKNGAVIWNPLDSVQKTASPVKQVQVAIIENHLDTADRR